MAIDRHYYKLVNAKMQRNVYLCTNYLLITLMLVSISLSIDGRIKTRIDDYLSNRKNDASKLRIVLEAGSMDGHFKSQEINDLFVYLQSRYPEYVSMEKFGSTYQNRDLIVFRLRKPSYKGMPITKSKILFTGAHHARELMSVTICLKIFVESLHSLINKTELSSFWTFNDLLIVPIVNLDAHTFISDAFGTPDWDGHKFKRKNMNPLYCP